MVILKFEGDGTLFGIKYCGSFEYLLTPNFKQIWEEVALSLRLDCPISTYLILKYLKKARFN